MIKKLMSQSRISLTDPNPTLPTIYDTSPCTLVFGSNYLSMRVFPAKNGALKFKLFRLKTLLIKPFIAS